MKISNCFLQILKLFKRKFAKEQKRNSIGEIINSSVFDSLKLKTEELVDSPNSIPNEFKQSERISRSIYSPININARTLKLKNNSFQSPAGIDEVSVNRLDFTTADFLKKISKIISKPHNDRNYFGLAIINVHEIHESEADIHYSPNEIETNDIKIENPYHSDIKIGFIKEAGKPLPAEFSYKVDTMVKFARFYIDSYPDAESWEGKDLI